MEERNIKIDLEKAKKWYKQGGDLKQVALQAFSEDELKDKFPTSWQEHKLNERKCKVCLVPAPCVEFSDNFCHFTTKEEAKAFVALGKLIQLRDEYWRLDNNWEPDWINDNSKYCIHSTKGGIILATWCNNNRILSFRTRELRDKFYENFKDLIEEAKMFL